MQVCPPLRNLETMAWATAASKSASSKTISGAFPPSSRATFLTVPAAWPISSLPTSVLPVNEIFFTAGLVVSSAPTGAGSEAVTTLNTPAGTPARPASSARASAASGVSSAGLATTVQPAASAGAALRAMVAKGKFHGVMAATTPTGCLITTRRMAGSWVGMVSP